ncbi:MAG: hypothetical protein AB1782_15660, partial [Cyanobacteriota bacterium]
QAALPIFTVFLLIILSFYLINIIFIQENTIKYVSECYFELTITVVISIFFLYTSFITTVLNTLKFGNSAIIEYLINNTTLIIPETKLYVYNILGENKKALELAQTIEADNKVPKGFFSKAGLRNTIKLFLADTFINAKRFNKALEILNSDISTYETDIVTIKKALIILQKDNNKEKAIEEGLEAIKINNNDLIRNPAPKKLEIIIILSDIYLSADMPDKALEILKPYLSILSKYPFYSYCKYSKYLISWYFYIYSKTLIKLNNNTDEIKLYLNKSIELFKSSWPAKCASELYKSM